MLQRVLTAKEKALGAEHTSTLNTINNLGLLHATQGQLVEREEMYLRPLAGRERVMGREARATLDTVYNLDNLYCA